ncbi:MAG TPA: HAD-IA family hydrolase [Rudaea sp.]|jgi:phosphoglycolate phosphatase|nr:HAD-IA family hydrolase [Rudaea sp.]
MILRGADIEAIFFDLDGTLVDSAPDLVAAMQRLRTEMSLPAVDAAHVGAVVSKGGRAMLRRAFADADERQIETLLPRFLELYSQAIATHTRTYPGIDALIDELERRRIKWGIVTNKPGWLARSLSAELKLDTCHAALVSGDCLPQKKPEPEPILYACQLAGVSASRSVYVGDDARDIEAGRRAGTMTVAVSWGYLAGEDPHAWQADLVIAAASELLPALGL